MTRTEAVARLVALGVRKPFRPQIEPETGVLMLATRRPADIVDGTLTGSEISLEGSAFRCWTSRVRLARTLADRHGLKLRLLTGEAEVWVAAALADDLLPKLGAKVKRQVKPLTEAQRASLMAHSFRSRRAKTGVPDPQPPKTGQEAI